MVDFGEQAVGRELQQLVAGAHALVAELLSLTAAVPVELAEQGSRFEPVLPDFKYFSSPEHHESVIDGKPALSTLDAELRDYQQAALQQFLKLFKGLVHYHHRLEKFLGDLQAGSFLDWSLDAVLEDSDGQQLLTEAVTLHGLLLLLLHQRMPGVLRERILVAICRHLDPGDPSNLATLRKLCAASTDAPAPAASLLASLHQRLRGQAIGGAGPHFLVDLQGTEQYLARFPLPAATLEALVSRLRSEDIFHQRQHFPGPEHRTTALSAQSACLMIALLSAPQLLQQDAAAMKSIIGRFFADRWVVSLFPGFTVDLSQAWDRYGAARSALSAQPLSSVKSLAQGYNAKARQLSADLRSELAEGVLDPSSLPGDMPRLLRKLRDANATLRWLLLHRTSSANKRVRDAVRAELSDADVIELLLNTAQLESLVKGLYQKLMEGRPARWQRASDAVARGLDELGQLFGGGTPLLPSMQAAADPRLAQWFGELAAAVRGLDLGSAAKTARKLQRMAAALEEAQQLHQVEASGLQARHFLEELRRQMQDMVRIIGINENTLATLAVVADSSYAWGLVQEHTPLLHGLLDADPGTLPRLLCWFLKLRSVLELPLLRLSQVGSKDLYPVSQFYSSQLVDYVRSVLQVIPGRMVVLALVTVARQAQKMGEMPTRLERAAVPGHVFAEERLQLARAARQLSALSSGVLAMDGVSIGVVQLPAKRLLEDGLREELRACIVGTCNGFRIEIGKEGLENQLNGVRERLSAFRHALEISQDHMRVPVLRIWDEEWRAYIRDCALQEEHSQSGGKIEAARDKASAGFFVKSKELAPAKFYGQIVDAVLALSDPATSMFLRPVSGWFDANGEKRVGLQLWAALRKTVGVEGLASLDRLLGVRARASLRKAADTANDLAGLAGGEASRSLEALDRALAPLPGLPDDAPRRYAESGPWQFGELADSLAAVGQSVLLRSQVAAELAGAVRLEGGGLAGALQGLDDATRINLLTLVAARSAEPTDNPPPEPPPGPAPTTLESVIALRPLLERSGLADPQRQLLARISPPPPLLPLLLALFTVAQLERYVYDERLATLAHRSRKEPRDCAPLVVGMVTFFQHLDQQHLFTYIQVLGQYVRIHVLQSASKLAIDARKNNHLRFSTEVVNVVAWLEEMYHYAGISREHLTTCIPAVLLDLVQSGM